LAGRTLRTDVSDWALFVDWCEATDHVQLSADPDTVLSFLAGCPAAVKTQRGRVTAIDHHHTATGYAPPDQTPAVLAALGRPVRGPFTPAPDTVSAVENMLRLLPSHGWTHGMFGRRDRCLLVLSQLAGVPYQHLATLPAGDITLTDRSATVTAGTRTWTIAPVADPVVGPALSSGGCGCWTSRPPTSAPQRSPTPSGTPPPSPGLPAPVPQNQHHRCRHHGGAVAAADQPMGSPAVPAPPAEPARHLPPRPGPARRPTSHLPHPPDPGPDTADQPAPAAATSVEPPDGAVFDRAAAQQAWTKRRNDLDSLADVADPMTDIDQQIAALQQRVNTLLDGRTTNGPERWSPGCVVGRDKVAPFGHTIWHHVRRSPRRPMARRWVRPQGRAAGRYGRAVSAAERRPIGGSGEVMDAYWRFAAERHDLYLRRIAALPQAPTPDPVLSQYRFTNAYRVCDRVSQYLVREVQYAHDQSAEEVVLRTVLFKLFNKVDTWELICDELGVPSFSSFDPAAVSALLSEEQRQGRAVYSAAYIVPPVSLCPVPKHRGHLELVALMLDGGLAEKARSADGLRGLYRLLRDFPGIGPFLAFQLAIDLNYSSAFDFDEAECVVAGPGALDGISKCAPGTHPRDAERFILDVCARQEDEFARLGLHFSGLFGRRLQPIDCQNLFCEISKYSRVAFPGVAGVAGRTRIKQRYVASGPLPTPFFPPKWGLDVPSDVRGGETGLVRRSVRHAAEFA